MCTEPQRSPRLEERAERWMGHADARLGHALIPYAEIREVRDAVVALWERAERAEEATREAYRVVSVRVKERDEATSREQDANVRDWLHREAMAFALGTFDEDGMPLSWEAMTARVNELRTTLRTLPSLRAQVERQRAALEEANTVIRIAASLMDEVAAVHKLTGGGFRDRLRVEMVRIAAEKGTRHAPAEAADVTEEEPHA